MKLLTEKLNYILQQIPEENFHKMIKYIENHYINKGYNVDKEFIIDFLTTNFSTGIWYDSLFNSISESDYKAIMELENNDWEKADIIGSWIGNYIVNNILNSK
jgi:hypothetical protein